MTDPFDTLESLRAHIWDRLDRGVARSDDPFRFVTLATVGADGPEARTVGLRAADRKAGTVEVHSDVRTGKMRALHRDPRAEILLWDRKTQLQIRLAVTVTPIVADTQRWSRIPAAARLNYGTDPAPGSPVSAPEDVTRTAKSSRFVALSGQVQRMDIVSLAHDPHRRAQLIGLRGAWVAP